MSLMDLQDAAVAAIEARFPKLKSCERHPGRFDLDELGRFLTVAPAVRVALLSIGGAAGTEEGLAQGDARLAAFIVTRDAGNVDKDKAAQAIVDGLIPLVTGFGQEVRGENLYSTPAGKQGVALWAVTWVQRAEMGTLVAEDGEMPEHLYASMSPKIGAAHEADYRDVSTGEAPDGA
ncbi:MAG: hypothetical protein IH626_01825 [Rhodospirillales bacterium]|nr:hypothetical protein [Rhodospirillales bacterium]